MEKSPKKSEEKKPDKTKDRGDKTNLLYKVFEDLEIIDFLPNGDRGDSKANFAKRSSRNLNSEKPATNYKGISNRGKKNNLEVTVSEVKTKKAEYVLDSDDSSKKEHQAKVYREERKNFEESKRKTERWTVKDIHKTKIENKARVHSEQVIKLKPEIPRIDNTRKIIDVKIKNQYDNAHIDEEVRRTDKVKNLRFLPHGKDLKFIEQDAIERRKLLRQKYTVKLKSSSKNVEAKDSFKNDGYELKYEASENFVREKLNETKDILQLDNGRMDGTRLTKKFKEVTQIQRRPIIKTIKNNDHRVYKAVTFIDQKETTPLQIKMPISKKSVETNTVKNKLKITASIDSEQNITKQKPVNTKKNTKAKRRLRKRPSSPALATCQASPQTEVAKWAPSSFTQHTKPYYEAWVDTTLAAITKCTEKDKLQFHKQHIIRTFKRALELDSRPNSPDLIYEKVNDEKYMGKITVNKAK